MISNLLALCIGISWITMEFMGQYNAMWLFFIFIVSEYPNYLTPFLSYRYYTLSNSVKKILNGTAKAFCRIRSLTNLLNIIITSTPIPNTDAYKSVVDYHNFPVFLAVWN